MPATPSQPAFARRLLPRLITASGVLALIWLLGWLALPLWLKPELEHQASQALGRTVTLETIRVRPWSLELELLGLRVARAGSGPDIPHQNTPQRNPEEPSQLSIQRVYVDADLASLWRMAPVVDAVRIEHPVLQVTHLGHGQHDWQDVIERLTTRPDPPEPETGPVRLALYNLQLLDGRIDLHDADQDRDHPVTDITLTVPFISTLGMAKDVRVSPRLSFALHGSTFETEADTRPFDASLGTEATLKIDRLDLTPYLDYLPRQLAVRPSQAVLDTELKVAFVQAPAPRVQLTGWVTAQGLTLTDAESRPLLQLDHARVELADVRPLERVALLGQVELNGPRLSLTRDAQGRLNALPQAQPKETNSIAPNARPNSENPPKTSKNETSEGWALGAAAVKLTDGQLDWLDAATPNTRQRPAHLGLAGLRVHTGPLKWPLPTEAEQALTFDASAQFVDGPLPHRREAHLSLTGQVLAQQTQARLGVDNLALDMVAPYTARHLLPTVKGQVALEAQARWQAGDLTLGVDRFSLTQFKLSQGGKDLASLDSLEVRNAQIRPLQHSVQLGQIALTRPMLPVQREADGSWMLTSWLKPAPESAPPLAAESPRPPDAPWSWQLPELTVTDGQLAWRDLQPALPVALQTHGVRLSVKNLASRGGTPATVTAQLRVMAGQTEPGTLDWQGTVALGEDGRSPLVRGRLDARRLPLHALTPYAADHLNLSLQRADASFTGHLAVATGAAGPTVQLQGDATLEDFRAHTVSTSPQAEHDGELLHWKTLNLKTLNVNLAPGAPPEIGVESGALSDFFARIAIGPDGRINLQDLVRSDPAVATPTAPPPPGGSAPLTAAPAPSTAARVRIGPFSLVNGAVDFSDRFIRPNYQAQLSELTGRLGGFSSEGAQASANGGQGPQMASLELRGKAEGTASLEITGQLNPLATPLALDIEGRVRNLELPPLSPYTVKYTGHGIERGKLSLDVAYQVQPDGQLTARNQLVLNQLTFGEPVAGAPASLPVKLAVALLADRHGVIDLNLPISGSLNDPAFSLVPIVFKIIGNVIAKAITSPFALLTGALGADADDMGHVTFAPGSTRLDTTSLDKLTRVAQALLDKPDLTLTVTGAAQLDAERTAYRRERLHAMVRAEQARQQPGTPSPAPLTGGDVTEYTRWLTALYKRADIPKPRNALGLAKDLTPDEMESLLLAQIPVSDTQMQALALQRGAVVRDHLVGLKVPAQRLFLGAPTTAPAVTENSAWQPQAQLKLAL